MILALGKWKQENQGQHLLHSEHKSNVSYTSQFQKKERQGEVVGKNKGNKNTDSPPSLTFLISCSGLCSWGKTGEGYGNHSSSLPILPLGPPWWSFQTGSLLTDYCLLNISLLTVGNVRPWEEGPDFIPSLVFISPPSWCINAPLPFKLYLETIDLHLQGPHLVFGPMGRKNCSIESYWEPSGRSARTPAFGGHL